MSYPPRKPRKHATPAEAREARSKALEPYPIGSAFPTRAHEDC